MEGLKNHSVEIRKGRESDAYGTFLVFERAYADLLRRLGSTTPTSIADSKKLERMWKVRQPLYTHLANTADQFWVAEKVDLVVGFSRSIRRGDLRQLTELFVLPEAQSGGVGRELMRLSFPDDRIKYKSILSTVDIRAQALYLKSGVQPRFLAYYFGKKPEQKELGNDLDVVPVNTIRNWIDLIASIDQQVVGHRRDIDHYWLESTREGVLYYQRDTCIGYGYLGMSNGPFALLDSEKYPFVLAHAEHFAAQVGRDHFGIEVPMVNYAAVDYLTNNGFRLDTFAAVLMTNQEFGKFQNYIFFSPSFYI